MMIVKKFDYRLKSFLSSDHEPATVIKNIKLNSTLHDAEDCKPMDCDTRRQDSDVPDKVVVVNSYQLAADLDAQACKVELEKNRQMWTQLLAEEPSAEELLLDACRLRSGKRIGSDFNLKDVKALSREGIIMKKLEHRNVLRLIGISHDDQYRPVLVSEFMQAGDLLRVLRDDTRRTTFKVGDLVEFGRQVACGMDYIHGKAKMVHRDLAARNCMVTNELNIKVADFGLSRFLDDDGNYIASPTSMLPAPWSAPEIFSCLQFNQKTDVWAYGVVLWEITTLGAAPYETMQAATILSQLAGGYRLAQPDSCPDQLYDVMLNCWSENPFKRESFHDLLLSVTAVACNHAIDGELAKAPTYCTASLRRVGRQSASPTGTGGLFECTDEQNATEDNVHDEFFGPAHGTTTKRGTVPETFSVPRREKRSCLKRSMRMIFLAAGAILTVTCIIMAALLATLHGGVDIGSASAEEKRMAAARTGRVFIIGGFSQGPSRLASVEIFDARRSLFLRELSATNLSSGRGNLGAAAVGNYVYAIGAGDAAGYSAVTQYLDVDNTQSTWQTCDSMSMARGYLAAASSSTAIFAIGGWNHNGSVNIIEVFDTKTQKWNANLRGMPTARYELSAGIIGDFLYAAGGGDNGRRLKVVEKYQISSNEWSTGVQMHYNRGCACATVLDRKFYVIGGYSEAYNTPHSSAEVYTPSTKTWIRIASMSTPRRNCGAAALGGLIYVFGGNDGKTYLDSVEVYNATIDSWRTLPAKMNVARDSFGIATILDAQ